MSSKRDKSTHNRRQHQNRRVSMRGIRRDPPDIGKLSKALIGLALAQREAQAEQAKPVAAPNAKTKARGDRDD